MTEEKTEQYRNSEAKFASPDGDNTGIGYYFDGVEVSPDEFSRLVEEKADRLRSERAEAGDE